MERIGILTSGGDCQGLNAAIRGVCMALYEHFDEDDIEIYGIMDGYKGLINGNYKLMNPKDFRGILSEGGTVLGTSRQPFKTIRVIGEDNVDKIKQMKDNYKRLKLDSLVVLGGNGSQKTANLLSKEGLNIVSLPKTIDNDLWGTDITFGFHSAVNIGANVIDSIRTTAMSHSRIFIVELMGHKTGWLALHAGIASGADAILIPEIPYKMSSVLRAIEKSKKQGKNFNIIAVAEGAMSREDYRDFKKDKKAQISVSYKLAKDIEYETGKEVRVTVPGHFQRGGSPCPYDRILATRFGTAAAQLIKNRKYGKMVAMRNEKVVAVDLEGIAGKLKVVPENSGVIKCARDIGICLGDD